MQMILSYIVLLKILVTVAFFKMIWLLDLIDKNAKTKPDLESPFFALLSIKFKNQVICNDFDQGFLKFKILHCGVKWNNFPFWWFLLWHLSLKHYFTICNGPIRYLYIDTLYPIHIGTSGYDWICVWLISLPPFRW